MAKRPNKNRLDADKCNLGILGWIVAAVFVIYTLCLLIPYAYAAFASVSNYKEYYLNIFPFPKEGVKLGNYVDAWNNLKHEGNGVPEMILNSLWFAGGSAVLNVFLSSCGAYVCAKYKFRFSEFIYVVMLVIMAVPIVGSTPSMIRLLRDLGIHDTIFAMVALNLNFTGIYFFVFHAHISGLSDTYVEAAEIDGASQFGIFIRIMCSMFTAWLRPTLMKGQSPSGYNSSICFVKSERQPVSLFVLPSTK